MDAVPVTADAAAAYVPVPMDCLQVDTVADFDLYLEGPPGQPFVLYRERHLPFTLEVRRRLRAAGVGQVFISAEQRSVYRRYVEQHLASILADGAIVPNRKSEILYTSLTGLVDDVMRDPRAKDLVPRSTAIVRNTCQFLHTQPGAMQHLMRVTSFDYYTYTHSVNVFVFTMSLAQRMLPRETVTDDFGVGALLHDIGKSQIDPAIVNCRSRLTPEQFAVMKLHPVYGCEILTEHGSVGHVGMDLVRHHHEKPSGKGYPDGLAGDEITPGARVIKIADVFDALTTRRSYKRALDTFPALKLMKDEMSAEFDPDLFRVFVQMLGEGSAK